MIYITSILFTISFVMYQKSQLKDLRISRDTKWKTWANVMKGILFVGCFLAQLFPMKVQDYLLAAAICSILFEVLINVVALGQPVFFIGKSSEFDKLGKWKWVILFSALIVTIFLKIKF